MEYERLKDFPVKEAPKKDDIVYVGDSTDDGNEVQSTIDQIFSSYSTALASIASLTSTADQMLYTTGLNTYDLTSLTAFGRNLIASVDATSAQTTLNLLIGVNVQGFSNALESIADLATSTDQMLYTIGTNNYATTTITSFGRTLVASIDAAAALTSLGAVNKAGDTMTGFLTLNADPTSNLHAATKQYVDNSIGGSGLYLRVANNLSDVADVTLSRNNLGLGSAATHAATDFALVANNLSDLTNVGTARTNLGLGTAAIQNVSYFLQTSNNLSDVVPATARTNLGLGSAALQATTFFLQTANNLSDLPNTTTARANLGLGSAATVNVPITAPNGGTGVASPTARTIPIAQGTSNFTFVGPLTNGQLLIGSTGANPVPATITAGTNISVTNGSGTITISATGSGAFNWSEVTGTTQSASTNSGYIANNAALVTITLPSTSNVGDELAIVGKGAGGWKIAQAASQQIRVGQLASTAGTGGYIQSTAQYNSIYLVCTIANTTWTTLGAPQGNITVI